MITHQIKTIKHPPFLAEVIKQLDQYDRPEKCLLVFPNQLSIDYFQPLCNKEKWKDSCVTLCQVMLMHSRIVPLPTLALLSRLYALSAHILNRKESFEQFYGWGFTLLQDFNAIDNHLVNGAELFTSLVHQKPLTSDSVVDQGPLDFFNKARVLPLWQQKEALLLQLPLLYQSFIEKLIEEGKGYEGLCYRMAQPLPEIMAQELVFIGFNLLTPVEEQFVRQCQAVASTTFLWDVDKHYLDNAINLAGHYLRQHREKKWFQKSFEPGSYLNDPHKKVFLREASTTVAQVQAVVAALQEKTNDGKPRFLPGQTAIVVSGSDLLIPLLDHLSNLSIPLHCRLDYPFSATVIYTLVERLVQLWEASVSEREERYSYMADVLALWYPFAETAAQLTAMCQSLDGRKLDHAFDLWLNKKELLSYLQEGLTYIYNHFIETDSLFLELNKMALYHVLAYIEGVLAEMATCSVSFFLNGLKQSSMLFHKANPVTGLYIVEVAESYNLDFEHVFFMNMNEGCFPKVTYNDSFLPYDLCYSFGLPLVDKVAENKTAYGFYRLLQRAQNIYCHYAQKNHLEPSSEMSRLLIQLTFDSKLKMIPSYHSMQLLERPIAAITIQKDHAVMQLLDRFLEGVVATSLTPAALISYLSCPLQFYFSYLLQLKQTVLTKDGAEAVQLGILFHSVMARLYQPFVGMQIDKSVVIQLKSTIKTKIKEAIAVQRTALGTPLFLHALLEKLLAAMLDVDGADAPFTLLGVEVGMKQPMVLDAQRKVWLGGMIDRIDRKNHLIRIIDYKTGLSNCKISSIATLFDPTKIKKNKAIFQLFFYAWLFQSLHKADDPQPIMPYLIQIREIFLKDYRPGIFIPQPDDGKKYQRIEDIMAYAQPFEEGLKGLLSEIFNPAIPFVQTEDLEICAYCPYVRICQRD